MPSQSDPSTIGVPGEVVPREVDDQVVLLIHGIRTQSEWQAMVRKKIAVPGRIEVIPIKYGYFDALRFWLPLGTRARPTERVHAQIRAARQKFPDADLSIIAHSFGTYIVGGILRKHFDLHVHRLILCGSVLPQDFPWEQIQGRFDADRVVNECGKADIWPVLAQSASWGYGASGTHGFGAVHVKDRFHAGGHGQYFDPAFVEDYWEPFIRRGDYKETAFEETMPPTPWWISALGILPLRWLAVALIAVAFAIGLPWILSEGGKGPLVPPDIQAEGGTGELVRVVLVGELIPLLQAEAPLVTHLRDLPPASTQKVKRRVLELTDSGAQGTVFLSNKLETSWVDPVVEVEVRGSDASFVPPAIAKEATLEAHLFPPGRDRQAPSRGGSLALDNGRARREFRGALPAGSVLVVVFAFGEDWNWPGPYQIIVALSDPRAR